MPTGLRIPIQVNAKGGIALETASRNDSKIILLACGNDSNDNAFQQNICIGNGMIFNIDDPLSRSVIRRRLIEIFRRFQAQQRFVLRPETIKWIEGEPGELILEFKYLNIESDQDVLFRQNLRAISGEARAIEVL